MKSNNDIMLHLLLFNIDAVCPTWTAHRFVTVPRDSKLVVKQALLFGCRHHDVAASAGSPQKTFTAADGWLIAVLLRTVLSGVRGRMSSAASTCDIQMNTSVLRLSRMHGPPLMAVVSAEQVT